MAFGSIPKSNVEIIKEKTSGETLLSILTITRMLNMPSKRINREKKTIAAMFRIYCRSNHEEQELCDDCKELLAYAGERLDKCPFQDRKTSCTKCLIHCYSQPMRERVREVMRFSGPKMMGRHPYLAIMHLIDGKKEPISKKE